jgi:serine phosphatase RsbU (regulator of sigma subunit)
MKINRCFLFLFLLSPLLSFTQVNQYGIPLLKNYTAQEYNAAEQNWAIIQDKRGVVYAGNNDNGVLEYDGESWNQIPVSNNSIVRSLAVDMEGTVYVGAVGEFGYLLPNNIGELEYQSLSNQIDSANSKFNNIWKVLVIGPRVYFVAEAYVYYYRNKEYKNAFERTGNALFAYEVDSRIFLGNYVDGLKELKDTSIEISPGAEHYANNNIFMMLPYDKDQLLVGTTFRGEITELSIYNMQTGQVLKNPFNDYTTQQLRSSFLYGAIPLPYNHYGLATIYNGAIVLNSKGEFVHHLNNSNGLQDETVFNLFYDAENESELWMALNSGIAKTEISSPFRVFGEESGLKGAIIDIIEFKDELYIASFNGVFVLKYEDNIPVFKKIKGIESQPWNFLQYKHAGVEKLLVGTAVGIYEIAKDVAIAIEDQIDSLKPGYKYYCYKLAQSEIRKNRIYIGDRAGIAFLNYDNGIWTVSKTYKGFEYEVRSIQEDDKGNIWLGTSFNGIVKLTIDEKDTTHVFYKLESGLPSLRNNVINKFNNRLFFTTQYGFYTFDETDERFYPDTLFPEEYHDGSIGIFRFSQDNESHFWISAHDPDFKNKWLERLKFENGKIIPDIMPFKRLPNEQHEVIYSNKDSITWIGMSNRLYSFNRNFEKNYRKGFKTLIRKVVYREDSVIFRGAYYSENGDGNRIISNTQPASLKPILKHQGNAITFFFAAPFFENEEANEYSYMLEGYNNQWSKWSDKAERGYTNLNKGKYTFNVKARNVYGVESDIASFEFTILPPWYQTVIAYIAYVILAVLIVYVIVKLYTRRLEQEKIRLEGIVRERTAEVVAQKDEIEKQRDQISDQKKGIEDSIHYASRIQRALLPGETTRSTLSEHFVLFKPRDIVSGDFYWMANIKNKTFVVAADCTGHGVPGAFMSMLGMSFLNEIVLKSEILKTNEILDKLRENVITSLKQTGKLDEAKDGMDLALYIWDRDTNEIEFSGANNPLLYIRELNKEELEMLKNGDESFVEKGSMHNGKYFLNQVKADKMPIGISAKADVPFSDNILKVEKGYTIYTFSDGYVDQFGGDQRKKFMVKKFKQLLLDIQDKSMPEQKEILDNAIEEWKGDIEQVDDILVFGVKI